MIGQTRSCGEHKLFLEDQGHDSLPIFFAEVACMPVALELEAALACVNP